MNEYFRLNPGCIDNIFSGIKKSTIKCADCNYQSVTYRPFSVKSLDCDQDLLTSLNKDSSVKEFDEDNEYKCENCKNYTKAHHIFFQNINPCWGPIIFF